MKKLILVSILGIGFNSEILAMLERSVSSRSSCRKSSTLASCYKNESPTKAEIISKSTTKTQTLANNIGNSTSGMKVKKNIDSNSCCRMTEILASTQEQHVREKTAIREQDTANMQVLISKINELQDQIKTEREEHKETTKKQEERIKELTEQNALDRRKLAAMEQANILREEANRKMEEQNSITRNAIQQANAREQARNNRRAWLVNQINVRRQTISTLSSKVNSSYRPVGGFSPFDIGHTRFVEEVANAKKRIPILKREIQDLRCELKSI